MLPLSLDFLPDDVLLKVLLLIDSRRDLYACILSSSRFFNIYNDRRTLVVSSTILREIRQQCKTKQEALAHADSIVNKLQHNVTLTSLIIYEALSPVLTPGPATQSFYRWTLKLCRLCTTIGPSAADRKLTWLERAYAAICTTEPSFDPEAPEHGVDRLSITLSSPRLSKAQQDLCRALAEEYTLRGRSRDCLRVQKSVLQRLTLKDPDSNIWACEIVKTFRTLQDHDGAIRYERSLYALCKLHNFLDASLTWARYIVSEYLTAGQVSKAILEQRNFLEDLRPGTPEHIAWARHLITMQKRAGLSTEALETKNALWRQMNVTTACYFGWARELADEYRKAGHGQRALEVIQLMHEASMRALARHPKDNVLRFHANQAIQALAIEYKCRGQSREASAIKLTLA